jgi:hypothetical protein
MLTVVRHHHQARAVQLLARSHISIRFDDDLFSAIFLLVRPDQSDEYTPKTARIIQGLEKAKARLSR